jgi:hypothetical protein
MHPKVIVPDKQGISTRFLTYMKQFDKAAGSRALGPDKTLSGKVQETLSQATSQARSVDEQKGYTKIAHDVCIVRHPSSRHLTNVI